MDRAAWVDAFVMHMSRLGSRASPQVLTEMAEAYYGSDSNADPVKMVQWRVDEIGLFHDDAWNDSGPLP
jgi:hypothetical protein